MGDVVKLGHYAVPMVRASKSICFMYLWAEVAKDEHSRLVCAPEKRAYEEFKVIHHFFVTALSNQYRALQGS